MQLAKAPVRQYQPRNVSLSPEALRHLYRLTALLGFRDNLSGALQALADYVMPEITAPVETTAWREATLAQLRAEGEILPIPGNVEALLAARRPKGVTKASISDAQWQELKRVSRLIDDCPNRQALLERLACQLAAFLPGMTSINTLRHAARSLQANQLHADQLHANQLHAHSSPAAPAVSNRSFQ